MKQIDYVTHRPLVEAKGNGKQLDKVVQNIVNKLPANPSWDDIQDGFDKAKSYEQTKSSWSGGFGKGITANYFHRIAKKLGVEKVWADDGDRPTVISADGKTATFLDPFDSDKDLAQQLNDKGMLSPAARLKYELRPPSAAKPDPVEEPKEEKPEEEKPKERRTQTGAGPLRFKDDDKPLDIDNLDDEGPNPQEYTANKKSCKDSHYYIKRSGKGYGLFFVGPDETESLVQTGKWADLDKIAKAENKKIENGEVDCGAVQAKAQGTAQDTEQGDDPTNVALQTNAPYKNDSNAAGTAGAAALGTAAFAAGLKKPKVPQAIARPVKPTPDGKAPKPTPDGKATVPGVKKPTAVPIQNKAGIKKPKPGTPELPKGSKIVRRKATATPAMPNAEFKGPRAKLGPIAQPKIAPVEQPKFTPKTPTRTKPPAPKVPTAELPTPKLTQPKVTGPITPRVANDIKAPGAGKKPSAPSNIEAPKIKLGKGKVVDLTPDNVKKYPRQTLKQIPLADMPKIPKMELGRMGTISDMLQKFLKKLQGLTSPDIKDTLRKLRKLPTTDPSIRSLYGAIDDIGGRLDLGKLTPNEIGKLSNVTSLLGNELEPKSIRNFRDQLTNFEIDADTGDFKATGTLDTDPQSRPLGSNELELDRKTSFSSDPGDILNDLKTTPPDKVPLKWFETPGVADDIFKKFKVNNPLLKNILSADVNLPDPPTARDFGKLAKDTKLNLDIEAQEKLTKQLRSAFNGQNGTIDLGKLNVNLSRLAINKPELAPSQASITEPQSRPILEPEANAKVPNADKPKAVELNLKSGIKIVDVDNINIEAPKVIAQTPKAQIPELDVFAMVKNNTVINNTAKLFTEPKVAKAASEIFKVELPTTDPKYRLAFQNVTALGKRLEVEPLPKKDIKTLSQIAVAPIADDPKFTKFIKDFKVSIPNDIITVANNSYDIDTGKPLESSKLDIQPREVSATKPDDILKQLDTTPKTAVPIDWFKMPTVADDVLAHYDVPKSSPLRDILSPEADLPELGRPLDTKAITADFAKKTNIDFEAQAKLAQQLKKSFNGQQGTIDLDSLNQNLENLVRQQNSFTSKEKPGTFPSTPDAERLAAMSGEDPKPRFTGDTTPSTYEPGTETQATQDRIAQQAARISADTQAINQRPVDEPNMSDSPEVAQIKKATANIAGPDGTRATDQVNTSATQQADAIKDNYKPKNFKPDMLLGQNYNELSSELDKAIDDSRMLQGKRDIKTDNDLKERNPELYDRLSADGEPPTKEKAKQMLDNMEFSGKVKSSFISKFSTQVSQMKADVAAGKKELQPMIDLVCQVAPGCDTAEAGSYFYEKVKSSPKAVKNLLNAKKSELIKKVGKEAFELAINPRAAARLGMKAGLGILGLLMVLVDIYDIVNILVMLGVIDDPNDAITDARSKDIDKIKQIMIDENLSDDDKRNQIKELLKTEEIDATNLSYFFGGFNVWMKQWGLTDKIDDVWNDESFMNETSMYKPVTVKTGPNEEQNLSFSNIENFEMEDLKRNPYKSLDINNLYKQIKDYANSDYKNLGYLMVGHSIQELPAPNETEFGVPGLVLYYAQFDSRNPNIPLIQAIDNVGGRVDLMKRIGERPLMTKPPSSDIANKIQSAIRSRYRIPDLDFIDVNKLKTQGAGALPGKMKDFAKKTEANAKKARRQVDIKGGITRYLERYDTYDNEEELLARNKKAKEVLAQLEKLKGEVNTRSSFYDMGSVHNFKGFPQQEAEALKTHYNSLIDLKKYAGMNENKIDILRQKAKLLREQIKQYKEINIIKG